MHVMNADIPTIPQLLPSTLELREGDRAVIT